jgi:hypothetical protein
MPQVQLPIFPAGSVEINRALACRVEGDQVVYFNGHLPVFTHAKKDLASFRHFSSQLVQGSATQGDVAKAFGVPLVAIKRATKLYIGNEGRRASTCRPGVERAPSSMQKNSSKPAPYWCRVIRCR